MNTRLTPNFSTFIQYPVNSVRPRHSVNQPSCRLSQVPFHVDLSTPSASNGTVFALKKGIFQKVLGETSGPVEVKNIFRKSVRLREKTGHGFVRAAN